MGVVHTIIYISKQAECTFVSKMNQNYHTPTRTLARELKEELCVIVYHQTFRLDILSSARKTATIGRNYIEAFITTIDVLQPIDYWANVMFNDEIQKML